LIPLTVLEILLGQLFEIAARKFVDCAAKLVRKSSRDILADFKPKKKPENSRDTGFSKFLMQFSRKKLKKLKNLIYLRKG